MGKRVSPQDLDYVQIDDALVDAAVRALEAADGGQIRKLTRGRR